MKTWNLVLIASACLASGAAQASPARHWRDVTCHRALHTNYTNNTGHDLVVDVAIYSGAMGRRCAASITVDGLTEINRNFVNNAIGAALCSATAVVPSGSVYSANNDDGVGSMKPDGHWFELTGENTAPCKPPQGPQN